MDLQLWRWSTVVQFTSLLMVAGLMRMFNIPAQKTKDNLVQLQREGFIKRSGKKLSIA